MEVRRWHEEPVEQLNERVGRQVLNTGRLTVARLHLAAGAVVPTHHHDNEQVANVLSGLLHFTIGDDEIELGAGESVAIPPNVPHSVVAAEDSLVIDVFAPVREDWVRGDDAYLRG